MIAKLFHHLGRLLSQDRHLSDRERYRERARQMCIDMGRPIPKALRR